MTAVTLVLTTVLCVAPFAKGGQDTSNVIPTNLPEATTSAVPRLVKFAGSLKDQAGKPITGPVNLIFSLYELQEGGSLLWSETQAVRADEQGHYAVLLGASQAEGLPVDLFASGRARWLGVQPQVPGMAELSRVLMVSTPYALKAADAETLGGKPASAFVTVDATAAGIENKAGAATASTLPGTRNSNSKTQPNGGMFNVGGSGAANYIPIWTNSTTLGDSLISQSGLNVLISAGSFGTSLKVNGPITGASLQSNGAITGGAITGTTLTTSTSSGTAVVGQSKGNGPLLSKPTGVYGYSPTGTGVVGWSLLSGDGVDGYSGSGAGVYGYSNWAGVFGQGAYASVLGESDNGVAVMANDFNGSGSIGTGVLATSSSLSNATIFANNFGGYGAISFFAGDHAGANGCNVNNLGDLYCTGSKSAMVALDDGRRVALYAVESPENWFEDYGSGSLSGGSAAISLDPAFAQTINAGNAGASYHVFLTPEGDCEGLYVANKTANGFEVRELRGGRSNVSFDYRIIAHRKGYENVRMREVTEQSNKLMAQAKSLAEARAKADETDRRPQSLQPPQPSTPPLLSQPTPDRKK
jgi:trimeric autotransporter adhesin